MKLEKWIGLLALGGLGVSFGAYALYLGYNNVVISSVYALLGAIGGYIVGKKEKTD